MRPLGLLWHAVKRAILFALLAGILFLLAAALFYRTVHGSRFFTYILPAVFFGAYVVAGVLCGYSIGVASAIQSKMDEMVRLVYPLVDPMVKRVLSEANFTERTISAGEFQRILEQVARPSERMPGFLARLLERRILHVIRSSVMGDFVKHWQETGDLHVSRETVERLFKDRLVEMTAQDIRGRFVWMQRGNYALAGVLLVCPIVVLKFFP